MKKWIVLCIILTVSWKAAAQNVEDNATISFDGSPQIMQFNDFLIDMSLLSPRKLPEFSATMLPPDATESYYKHFALPEDWSKWTINSTPVLMHTGTFHTWGGVFSTTTTLQSATFRLGKNSQITTYGQYTLDGRRIPDRSTPPWERKDFMGGMEVKFNKNFGIRVEVQQRRGSMYGPW